jgi:tetrahydromethanopterin S-methyltransferase subunit B
VWRFTTGAAPDITRPTVIFTDPANNATAVALNKRIAATFSELMAPSTITTTTFTLRHGTTPVSGAMTYTGTTAVFTPASILAANTAYTATISTDATDITGNALANAYVWNFTTGATPDTTPPTVLSTDPANGAIGVALNTTVEATFSEVMDPLTITTTTFTLRQGTTSISGAVTYAGTTALFRPAAPLASNTVYTAMLSTGAEDLAGNALAANYTWSFTTAVASDVLPPTVLSTDPANAATDVPLSKIISAIFSEAMNQSTITTATVTVAGLGGAVVTGTVTYAIGTRTVTFAPASILAVNTTYTGTIRGGITGVKDLAGNAMVNSYVWHFTTVAAPDITRPTVTSTDPHNGATGVALNKKIAATFSEWMDPSTITTTTFTVRQGTTSVSGAVTYAGMTALFTPATVLAPNTAYTATISTDAADTAGNELASSYVWNFTTGSAPDATPPTVISTDPANSATGVALNATIEPTFSEAMDPLTITTTTFTLRQGTTPVSGAVTYAGTTALFRPAAALAPNSVYSATVTTGVEDLAGNPLLSDYTWSFTTAAAPDVLPPTVLSTDPSNDATGVALSKIISAVFSEAMNQSTVTTATVSISGLGGASVTGTVSYAISTRTATFTPASALAGNTTYTGTIKGGAGGAKDLAGNALVSS